MLYVLLAPAGTATTAPTASPAAAAAAAAATSAVSPCCQQQPAACPCSTGASSVPAAAGRLDGAVLRTQAAAGDVPARYGPVRVKCGAPSAIHAACVTPASAHHGGSAALLRHRSGSHEVDYEAGCTAAATAALAGAVLRGMQQLSAAVGGVLPPAYSTPAPPASLREQTSMLRASVPAASSTVL